MTKFEHVPGFIPGKHCTEICHHTKGELAALPPKLHRDPYEPHTLYVCDACLPNVLAWLKKSRAAKAGARKRKPKARK